MLTMQYNIILPTDYDMDIIKKRVRDSGDKTDGFQDLKMKAYLIAERSRHGNYGNQYAPFYLWNKADGMNSFLLGGPFNNIINSFGCPAVNNWVVLYEHVKKTAEVQYAVVKTDHIKNLKGFASLLEDEKESFMKSISVPSTTAYIVSYNPSNWEICYFHMSTDLEALQRKEEGVLIYDVHHIS